LQRSQLLQRRSFVDIDVVSYFEELFQIQLLSDVSGHRASIFLSRDNANIRQEAS